MRYIINYCTGVTESIEVESIEEAQEIAESSMAYSEANVKITTLDGDIVRIARWYGAPPSDDNEPMLLSFGRHGYYAEWSEE